MNAWLSGALLGAVIWLLGHVLALDGMTGVYQHCGEAHLHRYLAEFDFRYNRRAALGVEDRTRSEDILRGAVGKRLTYRRLGGDQETSAVA